jgi:putative ABC transport system permease protein
MLIAHEFIDIKGLEFEKGRFYNESEANSGANVIVLVKLQARFEAVEPIEKNVRVYGQRFTVIGSAPLFGKDTQLYSG